MGLIEYNRSCSKILEVLERVKTKSLAPIELEQQQLQ